MDGIGWPAEGPHLEPCHLVVVPHTHWDREWYRTHEQFRHRLVRLLDRVLDGLERDPAFRHFTLDGQTIVVEDYLEIRPRARERIAKLVRDGRLLVGPWYVLPDEWLVSGEALIRNLRLGLRQAAELGGAMPIGYVPDQFGHVGQLPQIFRGFGFEGAVLWRGVGADVDRTTFLWEAPDGSRAFTVYLPSGYGNATRLPAAPDLLAERLRQAAVALAPFSRIGSRLLMYGDDHFEPDPAVLRALELAVGRLPEFSLEIGTLPGFLRRARREAGDDLPIHRGELRSALRAPLLPGCASARAWQKRADFRNDRLLTRYLEPLAAWLGLLGGEPDLEVIDHAWRVALQNHPHDSICGCSVDRVHEQMETRFQRVEELATAHLARVARDLLARVRAPGRGGAQGTGECVVVWNPNAAGPAQAESVVELAPGGEAAGVRRRASADGARRQSLHLRDASGRRIPLFAEVVEPGFVVGRRSFPLPVLRLMLPALGQEIAGQFVHSVHWQTAGPRVQLVVYLSEAPTGLDVAAIREALGALLERADLSHVDFEAWRLPRVRLRFSDTLPGHGIRVYRLARGRAGGAPRVRAERTRAGGAVVENAAFRVEVAPDGSVALLRRADGARLDDALRVVSEGDRGDEYNFDPVPGGALVERPSKVRVGLGPASESEVSAVISARYPVPAELHPDRQRRGTRTVALPVRLVVRLAADLDRVDVDLEVDNTARDHRLRLHVRAPFAATRFEVESAFEVVERPIEPAPGDFGSPHPAEFPVGACPMRAFATIDDGAAALTVASRGQAEVEAVREADGQSALAVTLLRAVGWLSRDDLTLRPGPAGPTLPTPGAQGLASHRAEVSLRWHRAGDADRVAEAHRFAVPAVAWLGGGGNQDGEGRIGDGDRLVAVDDPEVVVSALEPRPDGKALFRLYNASARRRRVSVACPAADRTAPTLVDLAERPVALGGTAPDPGIDFGPWQILGLRVG
jgi:hypothetical protein